MDENTGKSGELESSTPYNLVDLLDYVDGSVVSRTIKKAKTGTITIFSFDQGQELSEHTAPYDTFAQVLDGEVHLSIDGRDIIAAAGDIVLMPANIPHAVYADKKFKMLLTMIKEPEK